MPQEWHHGLNFRWQRINCRIPCTSQSAHPKLYSNTAKYLRSRNISHLAPRNPISSSWLSPGLSVAWRLPGREYLSAPRRERCSIGHCKPVIALWKLLWRMPSSGKSRTVYCGSPGPACNNLYKWSLPCVLSQKWDLSRRNSRLKTGSRLGCPTFCPCSAINRKRSLCTYPAQSYT